MRGKWLSTGRVPRMSADGRPYPSPLLHRCGQERVAEGRIQHPSSTPVRFVLCQIPGEFGESHAREPYGAIFGLLSADATRHRSFLVEGAVDHPAPYSLELCGL